MEILQALAFFGIGQMSIDSRIQSKVVSGQVTQEILDAARDEILEECKREYKRRAKELHPDITGGDLEKMQELNSIYAIAKQLQIHAQPPMPQMLIRVVHTGVWSGTSTASSSSTSTGGYGPFGW